VSVSVIVVVQDNGVAAAAEDGAAGRVP